MSLEGKTVMVTGGGRRIGRHLALAIAQAGADVIIHVGQALAEGRQTAAEILALGRRAWCLQADLNQPQAVEDLAARVFETAPLFGLVNNAAIFEPLSLKGTSLDAWQRHMNINLTAPFLLTREFARYLPESAEGRIVNIVDWRSLRPGSDHFPYTISKAALAALTRASAQSLAPRITVNGIALGAILPPAGSSDVSGIIDRVPAGRWARLDEVSDAVLFFLTGPGYITGEILHIDGGRHLV